MRQIGLVQTIAEPIYNTLVVPYIQLFLTMSNSIITIMHAF